MADAKPRNTTSDKVLVGVLVAAIIGALLFIYVWLPAQEESNAEPTPTETYAPATAPPVAANTPTPVTPSPNPTQTYEGGDADYDFGETNPGFRPTSDRQPQPGDADAAKAVLSEVLPRWGGIDLSGAGIAPDAWAKSVARGGGVTSEFTAWSQTRFYDLWTGVVQMDASAEVRGVTIDRELWNVGSHSMWRVTITRAIISDATGEELSNESVSWDILVKFDAEGDPGPLLDYFAAPEASNEKAETFYRPPLPNY